MSEEKPKNGAIYFDKRKVVQSFDGTVGIEYEIPFMMSVDHVANWVTTGQTERKALEKELHERITIACKSYFQETLAQKDSLVVLLTNPQQIFKDKNLTVRALLLQPEFRAKELLPKGVNTPDAFDPNSPYYTTDEAKAIRKKKHIQDSYAKKFGKGK
jgi:hypothetical protein